MNSHSNSYSHSYSDKQSARNAAYAREYEDWLRTLTPPEREALAAQGLDKPLIEERPASGCGFDNDFANSPAASCQPEEPAIATAPPQPIDRGGLSDEHLWDILRRLIGEILTLPNRSLTVECLAVVSGLSYSGDSMSAIAGRHKVTRAAVSKRCVELTERLDLLPSRAMRSLTARKAYREAQIRRHSTYENS
jgi:hypothetical protein